MGLGGGWGMAHVGYPQGFSHSNACCRFVPSSSVLASISIIADPMSNSDQSLADAAVATNHESSGSGASDREREPVSFGKAGSVCSRSVSEATVTDILGLHAMEDSVASAWWKQLSIAATLDHRIASPGWNGEYSRASVTVSGASNASLRSVDAYGSG